MSKKLSKRELARLAQTAPEYLSACSTGAATPSLDFIIRVMQARPGCYQLAEISPRLADKLQRISELSRPDDSPAENNHDGAEAARLPKNYPLK